jgi:hypothetical protein
VTKKFFFANVINFLAKEGIKMEERHTATTGWQTCCEAMVFMCFMSGWSLSRVVTKAWLGCHCGCLVEALGHSWSIGKKTRQRSTKPVEIKLISLVCPSLCQFYDQTVLFNCCLLKPRN